MVTSVGRRFRDGIADLRTEGRAPVLAAVAGAWFLSIGIRLTYPALLPHLRDAFGFGLATAGLLITVLWVAYALGQLPGGMLTDRFGSGRVLLFSTAATGIAIALVIASPSVGWLFATTVFLALATALAGPARLPLLSAVFPARGGTAIGLTQAAGNLGNTLLPLIGGLLAGVVTWHLGLAFVLPIVALVTLLIWRFVPRSPIDRSATAGEGLPATLQALRADFTSRSVVVVMAIQVLGSGSYQAFTGFYPTYLIEVKGIAPTHAAVLFGLFFATGTLVQPLSGAVGDRFGESRGLVFVLVPAGLALAVLPGLSGFPMLAIVTVVLGVMLGRSTLALTYLTTSLTAEVRGTGLGAIRTGYQLLGAGAPFLVGLLADAGLFDEAFFGLAAIFALMVGFTTLLPRKP
ncbi:MAG: nitrate/nitrite transporter [Salinirussus sp.]